MTLGNLTGSFITAFLVTLLELTEVVALVYALQAGGSDLRSAAYGAIAGVVAVALAGLVVGVAISAIFTTYSFYLLIVSALMLWGFGFFMIRSTVKTYFREARKRLGKGDGRRSLEEEFGSKALFAAGFSIGSVETMEAMIVLLALTAGGYGLEAFWGFVCGGVLLVGLGLLLNEEIRKVKVPELKWVGTSLLFTFAAFWTGEALEAKNLFDWPSLGPLGSDGNLIQLFIVALICVRVIVAARVNQKVQLLQAEMPTAGAT